MRSTDWRLRMEVMAAVGWPASVEEWAPFLAALYRECSIREIAEGLGVSSTLIRSGLPDAMIRPKKQALYRIGGKTVKEIAAELGRNVGVVYYRRSQGRRLDDPQDRRGRARVVIQGRTVRQWAEKWGVSWSCAHNRLVKMGLHKPDNRTANQREADRFFADQE